MAITRSRDCCNTAAGFIIGYLLTRDLLFARELLLGAILNTAKTLGTRWPQKQHSHMPVIFTW